MRLLYNVLAAAAALSTMAAATPPAAKANRVAIGDRVWFDSDGNGRQDPGEPGICAVEVIAKNGYGHIADRVFTDEQGRYLLNRLADGKAYRVILVVTEAGCLPAGVTADQLVATELHAADPLLDSDISGSSVIVTAPLSGEDLSIDAGFVARRSRATAP